MTRDIYVKKQQSAKTASQTKILGATATINSQSIIVLERDSAGHVTRCKGIVSVTAGGAGYAKGCIYIKTNATGEGFFRNVGSTSSCDFEAINTVDPVAVALENWKILIGDSENVGAGKEVTGDITITTEGVTAIGAGTVTPAMTAQTEARTATADGLTTGIIGVNTRHVTATSGNTDHIITLPDPIIGKELTINIGANGFKLQSSAPATIAINGGAGEAAKSDIAAESTLFLLCVSATSWKGFFMDADGDIAKIPAAA
jgi:hypothetical protein